MLVLPDWEKNLKEIQIVKKNVSMKMIELN